MEAADAAAVEEFAAKHGGAAPASMKRQQLTALQVRVAVILCVTISGYRLAAEQVTRVECVCVCVVCRPVLMTTMKCAPN